MSEPEFSLPQNDQHITIIGRTGSGKTQQGAWLLSESDFDKRPHIVIDYKGEDLFAGIPLIKPITLETPPPQAPGLYVVRIMPGQDEAVDNFLWQIWHQNNTCVFVDESYMIDKFSHAYNALLTQGRSKHINLINLTQRPSFCSRFIFSEASHLSIFHLNDKRDRKVAEGFTPLNLDEQLPAYHSYWYDVKQNESFLMRPVPNRDNIIARFNERLDELAKTQRPNRRFI